MNEALAKEIERKVRRREEIGSATGELAVPQELKDIPIPRDSDPRKRRAMKAATVAASNSSQMEDRHAVAETPTQQSSMEGGSRVVVEEGERRFQEFESTGHQTTISDENIKGGVTNG